MTSVTEYLRPANAPRPVAGRLGHPEGRKAAAAVDRYLAAKTPNLLPQLHRTRV